MSEFLFNQWLARSIGGRWVSDRRYLYYSPDPSKEPTVSNLTTEFKVEQVVDKVFAVSWDGVTSGRMQLELAGNTLHRDIGYFTNAPTKSTLQMVDDDTVVFHTSYDGVDYREEVRFIGENLRLRQTIGRNEGRLVLSGQYTERRFKS